jgi:hypothetical protein
MSGYAKALGSEASMHILLGCSLPTYRSPAPLAYTTIHIVWHEEVQAAFTAPQQPAFRSSVADALGAVGGGGSAAAAVAGG